MPVEFLTDEEAASYGRFNGPALRVELERAFFLDDTDKGFDRRHGQSLHARRQSGVKLYDDWSP